MSLTATRPSRSHLAGLAAGATVLAALLTGCGSDDQATAATDAAAQQDPAAQGEQGGQGGGGQMPGTFGLIAAIDGEVFQVQNQMTGQVAVTVGSSTTITDQAAATLADVTAGACVVVRSADDAGEADDAAADSETTEVVASSVAITAATDEGCAGGSGGLGGPGGPGGGERPTDLPSDMPEMPDGEMPAMPEMPEMPESGRPGGFGGLGAFGEVTSVTASGFVVEGMNGDVTVTVSGDTTYTQQVAADEDALEIGRCVQVQGDADDTGAVTATSIAVSDAVDDQCAR
ncbi:DUF5666 domain-containing protein [Nocardioides caeni]|uniref:DUF5666 domain-containing protein n=1 Tax=Nocardioides caeni TaxID=574700 RepID=A0A4S8MZM4_9ACTN|nr:DUF5666 domain-containing protein [Nocardioides caeni]THV08795.1 hypothetical protein E9934_19070 [Nocardioides caeni]